MSLRTEREAAMDEMAAWAVSNPQRFAPIVTRPPAHPAPRFVTPHQATGIARPQPAVLSLSTPALLAEVDDGLALRVCRRQTTARDVLLMQAMAERLRSMVMRPASNREALDGMLLIEIADESEARAPVLTFNAIERRHS